MQYILSLDQGTTSSRAMVFDHAGLPVAIAQQEFPQIFPQGGWVEHDPFDLWNSQVAVARQVVAQAGLQPTDIAAIGITSQRETVVVWDRRTGQPIHNAIVWQDRRTAAACDRLKADGLDQTIRSKTGLVLDAYFSASKLQWLLQHVDGAAVCAEAGELAFGTVDSWLLWQLTEGRVHATDASNASRTMLYNIHTGRWDDELLEIFQIPRAILPEVRSSSEVYGETTLLGPPLKIAWIAGDQNMPLFGQLCVRPGMVKNTYGTGCFMLMNTGETPIQSNCNLLTTIAWRIGDRTEYALEGSIFIAGAAVQWLRDGLGIIRSAADVEALAAQVADAGGVYMVPAFAGLAAPHWDSYARGTIVGLTRGSTAAHLARATLNAIALQTADVLTAMQSDAGMQLQELRVDGGATANNLLMQIQADLLGVPVLRSQTSETTALGAAYLAGLAVGYWTSTDQLLSQWQEERRFTPSIDAHRRQRLTAGWQRALERSKGWHQDGE